MILEGFEIEHWSCIQHLAVQDLPPTGIVVLHGPNGTGKSSIVAALRACLMDFSAQATARELKRYFPKTGDEKPRVSVCFRAQGDSWRITKHFGSKVSKLEKRTAGGWATEASTASDAHDQTRLLLGGKDSDEGLHQLLWLTQAEYHLPTPKDFDADVQSQLRNVLGVLQTPLDDRFAHLVHAQWLRWFNVKGKRKKESNLEKNLAILVQKRSDLDALNAEFQSYERMLDRSGDLEILQRDLQRQLDAATATRDALQAEYERSITRIEAHRLAVDRIGIAEKSVADALDLRQRRADTEERFRMESKAAESAREDADAKLRRLEEAEQQFRERKREAHSVKEISRELQGKRDGVHARQQASTQQSQLQVARDNLARAEQLHADLEALKQQTRAHPAPDSASLKQMEANRARVAKLRNELDAAALALTLIPEAGAVSAHLSIDGQAAAASSRHAIRRRAEIAIPGWGRLELTRGSDAREIDDIERELADLGRAFIAALAPFGIPISDAGALDRLRTLAAEQKVREPELKRIKQDLDRAAPSGLDPLKQHVARFEMLVAAGAALFDDGIPMEPIALERLATQLKVDLDANEKKLLALDDDTHRLDQEINGAPKSLRQQHAAAKETQITLHAVVESVRSELDRMLTAEQVALQLAAAEEMVQAARTELAAAELNDDERTIKDRLASAKDTVAALEAQIKEADKEYHGIEAVLSRTEGLHAKRAAAAALVEELTRQTDREMLESEAVDRLRALFEESRDKQLGTVLGPIHDRVLRWMKLLRIGNYQAMRFNDHFLPESLVAPNAEIGFDEESTGTIEQMALMVRLALGATLSKPDDPAVTVLDDPLTHSDAVRLNHMRAVLRSAAAGDAGSAPPAGPLQILVFTCHPEWFRLEDARVIDLAK